MEKSDWEQAQYKALDAKARRLLQSVVAAQQDREFGTDYLLATALEKPVVALIGTLAHAGHSDQTGYTRKNLSWSRTYIAEARAILEAARDVGLLEVRYPLIVKALAVIDRGLCEWLSSLSQYVER